MASQFKGSVHLLFRHHAAVGGRFDAGRKWRAFARDRQWRYSGVWYRVGYILELPSEHKGNFTNHIGVMFQSSAVRFEWRVSFGFLGQRTRHDFGPRLGDRNPYR